MRVPFAFDPPGRAPRRRGRFALRFCSVRHASFLEQLYAVFAASLDMVAPLLGRIGFDRLERPFAWFERKVKGALFDCRMCGQCVLSATGMSCPMNCPKNLRNGPCGGVRMDGSCEVFPEMPCVWVEAYQGSLRMRHGGRIRELQAAIDHRLKGRSTWLALARERLAGQHDRRSGTNR
jgi:Methylene-tetrahydrofolate reductase C terminal